MKNTKSILYKALAAALAAVLVIGLSVNISGGRLKATDADAVVEETPAPVETPVVETVVVEMPAETQPAATEAPAETEAAPAEVTEEVTEAAEAPAEETEATEAPAEETEATEAPAEETEAAEAAEETEAAEEEAEESEPVCTCGAAEDEEKTEHDPDCPCYVEPEEEEAAPERKAWITSSVEGQTTVKAGTPVTLFLNLEGYDDCEVSALWQYSTDGINWTDAGSGMQYTFNVSAENIGYRWHAVLSVIEPAE